MSWLRYSNVSVVSTDEIKMTHRGGGEIKYTEEL